MSSVFKYRIETKKLVIESSPEGIINSCLISDLFNNHLLGKVLIDEIYICEGIEKIGAKSFRNLNNIVKVTFPNSLKNIGEEAFSYCLNLEEICFPDNCNNIIIEDDAFSGCESLINLNITRGVKSIGSEAFSWCCGLENVYLPEGLEEIGLCAFASCYKLKNIKLPSSLETIKKLAFYNCNSLENIEFSEGLKCINSQAFKECKGLKNISFPSSLLKIEDEAFSQCINLKKVEFNEGLERIGNSAFLRCKSLDDVVLPSTLKFVGNRAFSLCRGLKNVLLNKEIEKIGECVFGDCTGLKKVYLPNGIKYISKGLFKDCLGLEKIEIPDSVNLIDEEAFQNCINLRDISLSKNIKILHKNTFKNCNMLEEIFVPEGVEELKEYLFDHCNSLKKIHLPSTLKYINCKYSFFNIINLETIYLNTKNGLKEIDVRDKHFVYNEDDLFFLKSDKTDEYSFYYNNEYISFNSSIITENIMFKNHLACLGEKDYIKLYYWSRKKYIPGLLLLLNMPLSDIDKFYLNKNGQVWQKLLKDSSIEFFEDQVSFFKLCYVLGMFNESSSIRDTAVNFLNNNVINVLDGFTIHSRFDGFDLKNGFNEEYAEFFVKYYNTRDFMVDIVEDEWGDDEEIDLTAASYNNFKNVKKIYPNKTLHTNREADLLLPEHVMNAIKMVEYDNINVDNDEFALVVGRYGYSQSQYEKLQEWFNKGKEIKKMKLFISKDQKLNGITYKLLDKDNPLNAVLGNITNCCQVLGGMGQECVEYGMTNPNSGFMTFNFENIILGQAWVWYDEESRTICLDNIEIPRRYIEKINQNKEIQKSFIDCLLRIEKNFKEEMYEKGLKVDKITIGQGYNDIKGILDKNFVLTKKCAQLSDYNGYSDAHNQYEIKKLENNINR